jgi:Iron-containing redox enzyme
MTVLEGHTAPRWAPTLPGARGPITETLFTALAGAPGAIDPISVASTSDPLADDDLQLALYVCYELHYRGFHGVDDRWEWHPAQVALRGELERVFEAALRSQFGSTSVVAPDEVIATLTRIANQPGPSLSRYLRDHATTEQAREYLVNRSAYQLKESDPHAWTVPRLTGKAKVALMEVLFDEFGSGRVDQVHALLYAEAMDALGLDSRYGAYLDVIPGRTLGPVNLMSLFGLHRRLRAASAGHLAISEMTSSLANKHVADGLRRMGHDERATRFFDVHVLADSVHDMIALHDLVGGLVEQDPELAGEIVFGAAAWAGIDAAYAGDLLDRWSAHESILRTPA